MLPWAEKSYIEMIFWVIAAIAVIIIGTKIREWGESDSGVRGGTDYDDDWGQDDGGFGE